MEMNNKDYAIGQVLNFGDGDYTITEIYYDFDPYLWYCKHYTAVNKENGKSTGGAIACKENLNPNCDIDGVLDGKVYSKYC